MFAKVRVYSVKACSSTNKLPSNEDTTASVSVSRFSNLKVCSLFAEAVEDVSKILSPFLNPISINDLVLVIVPL